MILDNFIATFKKESLDFQNEQVRTLNAGIPVSFTVNLLIALILCVVQWSLLPSAQVVIWMTALLLVLFFRLFFYFLYRIKSDRKRYSQLAVFRAGVLLTGLVWALSSVLMFPSNNIPNQAFLAFALAGMTAGAITSLSIDMVSLRLFSIPTLLALILRLVNEKSDIAFAMAVMVLLFLFFTYVIAKRANKDLTENIQLRFERSIHQESIAQSEHRLNEAQRVSHTGSFDWNINEDKILWSEEHFRIWGYSPGSISPGYSVFINAVHPDDAEAVEKSINQAMEGGKYYSIIHRIIHPDGSVRFIQGRGEVVFDDNLKPFRMYGTVQDITERKKAEQELLISAIAFESQEGIVITDAEGKIIKCNSAFTAITGYSITEATGKTPGQLVKSGKHDKEFYKSMWGILKKEKFWHGEIWNKRKDGVIYPELLSITAVQDSNGNITNYVGSLKDISEQKKNEELIHNLAFYDPLTELPNRRLLMDRLKQILASTMRNKKHGAILFLDLDNFKQLNDTRGHGVGDILLVEVASRLLKSVREDDTVARLGGDEFVVVLNDLNRDDEAAAFQAENIAEKIRDAISLPFKIGGEMCQVTPSIGISLFSDKEIVLDELFRRADSAMYQAKHAGRNTIRFFDPEMHSVLKLRMKLESDLKKSLPGNQLLSYYQMQVDADGSILGAEVLLRWRHPEKGLIMPLEFIPLAEETGLIESIGDWVIDSACMQLKKWESDVNKKDLYLAVNVSAHQFYQKDFVNRIQSIIKSAEINPKKLKLELTESTVLGNIDESIEKMRILKDTGVSFSMDDFGTGYSSLSYLSRLPLDQVKIDKSFVANSGNNKKDDAIVETIIGMARTLGLEVIAEGVETIEQKRFLENCGCFTHQGYLYGKPVPVDEFEKHLSEIFAAN